MADTELDTGKQEKTATSLAIGKQKAGKRDHEPAKGKNDSTTRSQAAGKSKTGEGAHNPGRGPVGRATE